ncbi:unnamed protein product, partial [marine sediment metagenome]
MVGENIQKAREYAQSMREQMMGGLGLGGKLFSSNPGILSNFQLGKRIQERIQTIKGGAISPLTSGRTKKEEEKISIDRSEEVKKLKYVEVKSSMFYFYFYPISSCSRTFLVILL